MKKDLILIAMSSLFLSISTFWIVIETITHIYKEYVFNKNCIFALVISLIFYIYVVRMTIKNANKKVEDL